MLQNAKIGDYFINRARGIAQLIGTRDDNGEFRYVFRQFNGSRSYHNAAGEMPLNYDPGSFIKEPCKGAAPLNPPSIEIEEKMTAWLAEKTDTTSADDR